MDLIELILLKNNKHLGREGRVFEADKPQADYLIKVGIAAPKGEKEGQNQPTCDAQYVKTTDPEQIAEHAPAPEVKKTAKPKKKTKKK